MKSDNDNDYVDEHQIREYGKEIYHKLLICLQCLYVDCVEARLSRPACSKEVGIDGVDISIRVDDNKSKYTAANDVGVVQRNEVDGKFPHLCFLVIDHSAY